MTVPVYDPCVQERAWEAQAKAIFHSDPECHSVTFVSAEGTSPVYTRDAEGNLTIGHEAFLYDTDALNGDRT